jgi:hypothetical protein
VSKKRSIWKNTPEGKTVRRNSIAKYWHSRPVELIESPAIRALSRTAHLCLLRIEIELRHHAGNGNGKLIVTKEQFVEYAGVNQRLVAPALRELEALGLVSIKHGRGGNAEHREPNRFRLEYLCGASDKEPLAEAWKRLETLKEAECVAREARSSKDPNKVAYSRRNSSRKNISRVHLVYPKSGPLSVPETENFSGPLSVPTSPGPLSVPTSDISGGGGAKGGRCLSGQDAPPLQPDQNSPKVWTTPVLTEIDYTPALRRLYRDTEPTMKRARALAPK